MGEDAVDPSGQRLAIERHWCVMPGTFPAELVGEPPGIGRRGSRRSAASRPHRPPASARDPPAPAAARPGRWRQAPDRRDRPSNRRAHLHCVAVAGDRGQARWKAARRGERPVSAARLSGRRRGCRLAARAAAAPCWRIERRCGPRPARDPVRRVQRLSGRSGTRLAFGKCVARRQATRFHK